MKTVKIVNRKTNETEFFYFGNVESSMCFLLEMKLKLNPKDFRVEFGTEGRVIRTKGITMY
jgi:hypothetical protein